MTVIDLNGVAHRMYATLASHYPGTLPEDVVRRIWAAARGGKDEPLTVALAQLPETPADVLAAIAKVPAAKVRSAYLSRPGLSAAEVGTVLAQEKRVTVLAALADSESTAPAVFDALADQMRQRGSRQIAIALMKSERTPSPARLAALAWLDETSREFGWQMIRDVEAAVTRLGDTEADEAARTLGPRIYRSLVHRAGLSVPARLRMLTEYVIPRLGGTSFFTFEAIGSNALVTRLLACPDVQLEVLVALDDALSRPLASVSEEYAVAWRRQIVQQTGGLVSLDLAADEHALRMSTLQTATDPSADVATLAALAETALAEADAALAARLAANPHVPVTATLPLLPLLDTAATVRAAYRGQDKVAGRDPVRVALLAAHPVLLTGEAAATGRAPIPIATWADFDDAARAATELTALLGERVTTLPEGQRSDPALRALLALATAPEAVAADAVTWLPWWYVRADVFSPSVRHVTASTQILGRLVALQVEHLGADQDAWSVFERLTPDWTGTVGDLFAAVVGINAAS